MMSESMRTEFDVKMKEFLSIAKKRSVLEYQDVVDFFREFPLRGRESFSR